MKTITLLSAETYNENQTTKYWRSVECKPQTSELKTWSTNHPYFIMKGVVVSSHDEKEIGMEKDVHIQTYSFWLEPKIQEGKYFVN